VILVVLAAGRGRRLGGLTAATPKILVPIFEGRRLLDFLTEAVDQVDGLEEMLLVTGYSAPSINAAVALKPRTKPLAIRYNPFYDLAGPIGSIWLSQVWLSGSDFMLSNGDTYYSARSLATMARLTMKGVYLGIERGGNYGNDDMRIVLNETGGLLRVGKDVPVDLSAGVSAGLLAVVGEVARGQFGAAIDSLARSNENLAPGKAWHNMCNALVESGVPVGTVPLEPWEWHEIDSSQDIEVFNAKLRSSRGMGSLEAPDLRKE
jgi:choline kinase